VLFCRSKAEREASPHPALRATFSREREKGKGTQYFLARLAFGVSDFPADAAGIKHSRYRPPHTAGARTLSPA